MMICENWINQIATEMKIDVNIIRESNFYKKYDLTHYKQELYDFRIHEMWNQLKISSEYDKRKMEVEKFNST